jgi:hypothetical protein
MPLLNQEPKMSISQARSSRDSSLTVVIEGIIKIFAGSGMNPVATSQIRADKDGRRRGL